MACRARARWESIALLICCWPHALIGAASGQKPSPTPNSGDLSALLERMGASRLTNEQVSARYTCDWTTSCKEYNSKGKFLGEHSTKWVAVTIDGVEYDRIVEANGKPLTTKKQIAEQKRSDSTGELGHDYDFVFQFLGLDPRDYIYSDLPVSYLDTLFDNRVIGHEVINGRDNLVVESTPRTDASPISDRAKSALDWKEKTWIDVEDAMPTRYDVELLNRKDYLQKGSTFRVENARLLIAESGSFHLPPKVWLVRTITGHPICRILWLTQVGVCEHNFYNYRRFQTDAHMLDDSIPELPASDVGKQP
jgi:hypothetical protein